MTDSNPFPLYDETTAPAAARAKLAEIKRVDGVIANLEKVMAGAPALLSAYFDLHQLYETTSLSPIEQQVVFQTANFEHECTYCMPWHTLLSRRAGMSQGDIDALRAGAAMPDERLEALRRFTRSMLHTRGRVAQADLEAFFGAGYTPQQAMEVVLGLAIKTMSNYTNALSAPPLDGLIKGDVWTKPLIRRAES